MSLLSMQSVTTSYGLTQALFDITLSIEEGEVLALLGRNGMGKSTTIKTICKLLPVQSGTLEFDGHNLNRYPVHKVARLGIGLVPEGRRCFTSLSVKENLLCAARPGFWDIQRVGKLFPRLSERSSQSAAFLSGGEQQMLAIARALMTNPRLLLLDEATEGLAPLIRSEIWSVIAKLKAESGLSILVVDKSIEELSSVCDRVVVLERGCSVWSEGIEKLSDTVLDRYIGV